MKIVQFILSLLMLSTVCYAGQSLFPQKYGDQEEVLEQGASILISKKNHTVLMYQTCESIEKRSANFFFAVKNNGEIPLNIYFDNLKVTDQFGRQVQVVHKNKLIEREGGKKSWDQFWSASQTQSDYAKAEKAGDITSCSNTSTNYNSNFNSYGSNQKTSCNLQGNSQSRTVNTVQVEALRQQAYRQADIDAQYREMSITANYNSNVASIQDYYFDSSTVFPSQTYRANFQIQMNKTIEKDLEYLYFTFFFDGEEHTFCFYCKR
jgi:hypothetical protein